MIKNKKGIINIVNTKNLIIRLIFFLIACFGITLCYNMFLVPNNYVIGGMSGLAIIFKHFTGLSPSIFLYISMVVLTVVSYVFLDKQTTFKTLWGFFIYNVMVSLTAPLAKTINLHFESTFIMLMIVAAVYGIGYGLIYRAGFNTGGSDTIIMIINRYLKIPMGEAGNWTNVFIIIFGLIVFGPTKTVYSVIILIIGNKLTDIVMLGIKDSKMCYIKSKKSEVVADYLMNTLHMGVTEISSKGGIFTKREPVLLVIVPVDKYYGFKHVIKNLDKESFILTNDCYGVSGGYKKQIIPF